MCVRHTLQSHPSKTKNDNTRFEKRYGMQMKNEKTHKSEKSLKRAQIAAIVCSLLLVPFEFFWEPISWTLDPFIPGGFGYYSAAMFCYLFKYCFFAGALIFLIVSLIEIFLLWRKNRDLNRINKLLTVASIIIPLLLCVLVLIFWLR